MSIAAFVWNLNILDMLVMSSVACICCCMWISWRLTHMLEPCSIIGMCNSCKFSGQTLANLPCTVNLLVSRSLSLLLLHSSSAVVMVSNCLPQYSEAVFTRMALLPLPRFDRVQSVIRVLGITSRRPQLKAEHVLCWQKSRRCCVAGFSAAGI